VHDPRAVWDGLPAPVREGVDTALRSRDTIGAILTLQGGLEAPISLVQAQEVAADRSRWLADHGEIEPEPVPTVEDLTAKAAQIPARIVAIEAVWEGESDGWFVVLLAIIERASRHHHRFDEVWLTPLRRGGDIRIFRNQVPPWPEAAEASELGQALAAAFGVPFYFFDPQTPDVDQPRWWATPQ
jgi:hypothetical protein